MRQVGGFLRVLWFPPPIKLTATIYKNVTEILLKVALNTITLTIFHIKSIPKQEKSIINNDLSNTINLVFTLDKYYKNQQKIFIEIAHCIEYYKNKQNIYIDTVYGTGPFLYPTSILLIKRQASVICFLLLL